MEKKNSNPNKPKQKKKMEFEFCTVCKLNHDQGRRHNYIPNHTKSLSSFLSRFLKKISDIRFFIKTPILLRPEHASHNRLWCVFCDSDIQELDSIFACSNAIRHLASSEHLKNLKGFLWKYGGGMDRVDSFRVSDTDLAKWENKCDTLKNSTPSTSGRLCERLLGDSKDIHINIYSDNLDSSERNTFPSHELSISNGFIPLQNFTNEKIQVSCTKVSEVANLGTRMNQITSLPMTTHNNMDLRGMHVKTLIPKDLTVYRDNSVYRDDQQSLSGSCRNTSNARAPSFRGVGRVGNGENSNQVLQSLTQISPLLSEESKENVHSGAPPPWFEQSEENQLNGHVSTHFHTSIVSSSKSGRSKKLNPNRVGAAWAEKRKIELEKEKRGGIASNTCDPNWLPNFGRVWQSGSRKDSRKEFEMENEKSLETNNLSEPPIKLQPYISKRMRKESGDGNDINGGHFE